MNEERKVDRIWVLTLYGDLAEKFTDVDEAIAYIAKQPEKDSGHLVRIELQVRFTTGQKIDGAFSNKEDAIEFLENRKKGLL